VKHSVAIVILNWNGLNDTIECIESLNRITYANYEIIVVDNGSTDESVACIRRRYPNIILIENEENLGYAEGNNVAIRYTLEKKVDYVLLLNNDTVVEPRFLNKLVETAESDPQIGIVGPKVVYFNDPTKIWSAGGRTSLFTGRPHNIGNKSISTSCKGIRIVDFVSGCALLVKTQVIKKIGLLDNDYFLYLEDADWNYRARKARYISLVNCDATVLHKTEKSGVASALLYYYFTRNRLLFLKKHARWYHLITSIPYFTARSSAIFIWNLISGNRLKCRCMFAGFRDFVVGQFGQYTLTSVLTDHS
jgi:GT2 family glycosyltransferase